MNEYNMKRWREQKNLLSRIKKYGLENSGNALIFAAKAHRGQFRKGRPFPFIYHPICVANLLLWKGIEEDDVIAAALLHDVVEDTSITIQDLPFNQRIKHLVSLLTFDESNMTREEYYSRLSSDVCAVLIKMADRIDNLRSMLIDFADDEKKLLKQKTVTRNQFMPYVNKWLKAYENGYVMYAILLDLKKGLFNAIDDIEDHLERRARENDKEW